MIYFKLTSSFTLPNGNETTLGITLQCQDVNYQNTLDDAIVVARVTAKRMCNDIEPLIINNILQLSLTQYNAIVKAPEILDADIIALEEELNQTQNDTITEE